MVLIDSSVISTIIECRKKRAELVFKKGYLNWKKSSNDFLIKHIDLDLIEIENQLKELEKKLGKYSIVFPDQDKLDELNEKVSSLDPEELYETMESKEGDVFELLKERGELLRYLYEKREEISKFNVLLQKLKEKDRDSITALLKNKENFSEEEILTLKDKTLKSNLFKLFSRLDFPVSKENLNISEERVFVGSRAVWVPNSMSEKIVEMNKTMDELSRKIQFKNAEKQIKNFSENEEKEFQSMQSQYLTLLKEKDKILHDFSD